MTRNEDLDDLRGFAMLWVIVIHCLYWSGLFTTEPGSTIKSLLLIEMPLFFFITGASNSMGRKRGAIDFYLIRFQRILLPYFIFCLVCVVLSFITGKLMPAHAEAKFITFTFPEIITPVTQLPYLTGALWFISVYLYVIMLFPLFRWYYDKFQSNITKILPLVILAIFIMAITFSSSQSGMYTAKMILFYSFWTYMGLFYPMLNRNIPNKEKLKIVAGVIVIAICILLMVLYFHQSLNMQNNKFPPNGVFLLYTFGVLSIFYLLLNKLLKFIGFLKNSSIFSWIFDQYKRNCYTIFLYHPFSFLFLLMITLFTKSHDYLYKNEWIAICVYILFTIPVSAVLGKIFSWAERIKVINR